MGMKEKFEASLQSLRGPLVDITMEAREIDVLITLHYPWFCALPVSIYTIYKRLRRQ